MAIAGSTVETKPSSGCAAGQAMPIVPSGSYIASVTFEDLVWCTMPSNLSACAAYQKQRRTEISTSRRAAFLAAPKLRSRSSNSGARADRFSPR